MRTDGRRNTVIWRKAVCALKPGIGLGKASRSDKSGFLDEPNFPICISPLDTAGKLVDPFAFGMSKLAPAARAHRSGARHSDSLAYRPRMVLNAGFAAGPVTMERY